MRRSLLLWVVLVGACRFGFDAGALTTGDALLDAPAGGARCSGRTTFGAGAGASAAPGMYELAIAPDLVGCVYTIAVDGAGGGRGNHDNPPDNADGGDGGRIVFELVPVSAGVLSIVIGGGGTGEIASGTLDDPGPGAGGGGSSQVALLVPDGGSPLVLAIAGGGGGGGWAERGSHGGGGDGECATNADEGSTGGCAGVTGTPHIGGELGGNCPVVGGIRIPCGGPGGSGTYGAGGWGLGAGFGGNEGGNQGSGGGGGGYGGGSAGGDAGDPGLGGGAYLAATVRLVGGATGGADNGARYANSLALAGGDGRVDIELRTP